VVVEVEASNELAGSSVSFLRERVRDLRIREFLMELVNFTAPSDLAVLS